jgi:YHS domain-containing protein
VSLKKKLQLSPQAESLESQNVINRRRAVLSKSFPFTGGSEPSLFLCLDYYIDSDPCLRSISTENTRRICDGRGKTYYFYIDFGYKSFTQHVSVHHGRSPGTDLQGR